MITAGIMVLAGCARPPEKAENTNIRVFSEVKNDEEFFLLHLKSEITNENSMKALLDVKGAIYLSDGLSESKDAIEIPFDIPIMFPFSQGEISSVKRMNESDVLSLVQILGIDKDDFLANRTIDEVQLNSRFVSMKILSWKSENIIDVLKDRVNEKN